MKDFCSPRQAAQETGLRYGQIMRRIRSGKIKAVKIDWNWAIPQTEVAKLINQIKQGQ